MPADKWDRFAAKPTAKADQWDRYATTATVEPETETPKQESFISATKPAGSKAESVERWAEQLINDLKHGTDITGVGAILKKMGAPGLHAGVPESVGDFMGSVPLGISRMIKGGGEAAQEGKRWKGTKDVVGGAMETATIPSLMVGPEMAGAAPKLLPSTEKAGKLLDAVEKVAGHVEVDVNGPGKAAMKFFENVQHGGSPSQLINKFLQRVTKADAPPLTYAEARKFYENATRLSFDASNRLNPKAQYLLTQFTKELDQAVHASASEVGQGPSYATAMKAYHRAAQFARAAKYTGKTALAGAGAYGAYDLIRGVMGRR